jgi:PAS domain S-box-containing protein
MLDKRHVPLRRKAGGRRAATGQAGRVLRARGDALTEGIVGAASVGIITMDSRQRILTINPAACAMFGYAADELLRGPLTKLMPERHRASHESDVRRFGLEGPAPRHMGRERDVMALRADGTEFPVDVAISRVQIGKERLFTAVLRDISERRHAEEALRHNEASLRRLLQALPEAVLVVRDDRITFVNRAAELLLARDERELLHSDLLVLVHPDSVDLVRSHLLKPDGAAAASPVTRIQVLRPDGAVRVVEAASTFFEEQVNGAIAVVMRDTSELAQARQALSESHATLRRLIAAQDRVQENERRRIARELHDDLQQALAAIRIDITAAANRIAAALPDVAQLLGETGELAGTAMESTRRIINDLRPQMLEDLGLTDALEALLSQFRRRFRIECVFNGTDDGPPDSPLAASVTTCLYRAAQEALGNVAKHAHAGRVEVTYRRTRTGDILLRIRDDGCGTAIAAPRHPGSFGMLGMQERVLAIGGTMAVTSTPGVGTTIDVRVPGPWETRVPGPSAALLLAPPATPAPPPHLLPAIIDALGGNVVLIDKGGAIVLVNRAWRAFAAQCGDPEMRGCGPGVNYLDVCRHSAASDPMAQVALRGITEVLDGRAVEFSMEYPCNSPTQALWFRMHVAPIDAHSFLVTHVNLDRLPGVPSAGMVAL